MGISYVPDWDDKLQNVVLNQEPHFGQPEQQQNESHQEEQFKTQELRCVIRKVFIPAAFLGYQNDHWRIQIQSAGSNWLLAITGTGPPAPALGPMALGPGPGNLMMES